MILRKSPRYLVAFQQFRFKFNTALLVYMIGFDLLLSFLVQVLDPLIDLYNRLDRLIPPRWQQ